MPAILPGHNGIFIFMVSERRTHVVSKLGGPPTIHARVQEIFWAQSVLIVVVLSPTGHYMLRSFGFSLLIERDIP